MARKPISIDSELHARFLEKREGRTLIHLIDTAARQYLDDTRLYLDIPDDIMVKIRGLCVAQGKTVNEVVNDIIKGGLK